MDISSNKISKMNEKKKKKIRMAIYVAMKVARFDQKIELYSLDIL